MGTHKRKGDSAKARRVKGLEDRLGELLANMPADRLAAFESFCEKQEEREARQGTKETGTMADMLRKTIEASGLSLYRVAKDAGISYPTLHRFMSGERSISLDAFERLCGRMGLALVHGEAGKD